MPGLLVIDVKTKTQEICEATAVRGNCFFFVNSTQ